MHIELTRTIWCGFVLFRTMNQIKYILEDLWTTLRRVSLTQAERIVMRAKIELYMAKQEPVVVESKRST